LNGHYPVFVWRLTDTGTAHLRDVTDHRSDGPVGLAACGRRVFWGIVTGRNAPRCKRCRKALADVARYSPADGELAANVWCAYCGERMLVTLDTDDWFCPHCGGREKEGDGCIDAPEGAPRALDP
jgi:DNA-directed RNA polymerase subunit RPC12/RpoP